MPHAAQGAGPGPAGPVPPPAAGPVGQAGPAGGGGAQLDRATACRLLQEAQASGQQVPPQAMQLLQAVCSGQGPQRAEDGTIIVGTMPPELNSLWMAALDENKEFAFTP